MGNFIFLGPLDLHMTVSFNSQSDCRVQFASFVTTGVMIASFNSLGVKSAKTPIVLGGFMQLTLKTIDQQVKKKKLWDLK